MTLAERALALALPPGGITFVPGETALRGRLDVVKDILDTPAGRALAALVAAVEAMVDGGRREYDDHYAMETDTAMEYGSVEAAIDALREAVGEKG